MNRLTLLSALFSSFALAQTPTLPSAEDIAAGSRIFRSHCAECHGLKGDGGRGPDLTTGDLRHGSSDVALHRTIAFGIPGTQMPGVYFDEHQVGQIVAFVRSLSAKPTPRNVPGNARAGEALFSAKGGCSTCHMVNGEGGRRGPDLTNIGAARTPEHLRTSLVDPGKEVAARWWSVRATSEDGRTITGRRLSEDTYSLQILDSSENLRSLDKARLRSLDIGKTSVMPSYKGALSPAELDDIIAYLYSLGRKARPQ